LHHGTVKCQNTIYAGLMSVAPKITALRMLQHVRRDGSVGMVNRPRAGRPWNRSSIPGSSKYFSLFSTASRAPWGPPSLLSNGYYGLLHRGKNGRAVKPTLHLLLRLHTNRAIPALPHTSLWCGAKLYRGAALRYWILIRTVQHWHATRDLVLCGPYLFIPVSIPSSS
jgi:hypothetical protein